MTNNEDFKLNSNHHWWLRSNFGDPIVAYKRHRRDVYSLSADTRFAMVRAISDKLRLSQRPRKPMTLDNACQLWWMSNNQYQQMLTRLGLPF